mmetsp:Transcript_9102/g.16407  ORF Transcript_9102/g.16407 Transcript_9102/m.16407 type:complete len:234 (-) Transcript_9102:154-855(-)
MIMSYSPMRWFCPPPMSTAHLSSSRSPGTVFLVSNTLAGYPSVSATMAAVAVAMPPIRCIKLRATRSAMRIPCAGPVTTPNFCPLVTRSPSAADHSTLMRGSICSNTFSATTSPASTPSALARKVATAFVSFGIVDKEVTSPTPPASSSRARQIRATRSKVGCSGGGIGPLTLAMSVCARMALPFRSPVRRQRAGMQDRVPAAPVACLSFRRATTCAAAAENGGRWPEAASRL